MPYVIATSRSLHEKIALRLSAITGKDFILITKKDDLTFERMAEIKPRYIFFPHWSYIIPASIYEAFECVIFHMTDLPFGRGGSPLQNLITRGIYETKISALRCVKEIDAGPIYLKQPISLFGTADEIFIRASKIVEKIIITIIEKEPQPVSQQGEIVCFSRRKPQDSNIEGLTELEQIYDFIRMLDAEGYPPAFFETSQFRFEFQRASLRDGKIISDVIITKKDKNEEDPGNSCSS